MFLVPLAKTLRPYQWYKNLLLFVGLVFSHSLTSPEHYLPAALGFVFFCLMSGSVYILNDIVDRKKDRNHPIKCRRPIASGELNVKVAAIFMVLFVVGCPLGAYFLIKHSFAIILLIYFTLFVVYSFILKYLVLVDVFTIAVGFVLRAIAGILAVKEAQVSWWLIMCTLFLALFLAFGKRRAEMVGMGKKGSGEYRSVYSRYSVAMLDHFIAVTACATVVVYCLYSAFSPHDGMVLTIPFVVYGVFKYMQLIHSENMGAEPERMFINGWILGSLLLWGVVTLLVLYGKADIVLDFIKFR